MKILIAGLGLIGGSFALALRDREIADEILGVEKSDENAAEALRLGLADRIVTLEEGVPQADLVVLATSHPPPGVPAVFAPLAGSDRLIADSGDGARLSALARRAGLQCATMPPHAYMYAIPLKLYKKYAIRRYGFHGTSHAYVSERGSELAGSYKHGGWLTAHLGNGSSTCAIWNGQSVDTSMGLTPLEGLIMGDRKSVV